MVTQRCAAVSKRSSVKVDAMVGVWVYAPVERVREEAAQGCRKIAEVRWGTRAFEIKVVNAVVCCSMLIARGVGGVQFVLIAFSVYPLRPGSVWGV